MARHLADGTPVTPESLMDAIEAVCIWLHEAPLDEIEAVEKALGRNAPIVEADRAMHLVAALHGERT